MIVSTETLRLVSWVLIGLNFGLIGVNFHIARRNRKILNDLTKIRDGAIELQAQIRRAAGLRLEKERSGTGEGTAAQETEALSADDTLDNRPHVPTIN